jgi:large subunit ribosomal protein L16
MLSPKRVRHRKQHRPRPLKGLSTGHTEVHVGDFGLMATTPGWITARQIEAARIAMTRAVKRGGKIRITIFPDRSITRKPLETRMGSGKGAPDHWVAAVKPGRVMFEIGGVPPELAREALRKAAHKLPVCTRFVSREDA